MGEGGNSSQSSLTVIKSNTNNNPNAIQGSGSSISPKPFKWSNHGNTNGSMIATNAAAPQIAGVGDKPHVSSNVHTSSKIQDIQKEVSFMYLG